jgi:hypothetical protein
MIFDLDDVTTYPIFLLRVWDKNFTKDVLIGFRYLTVKIVYLKNYLDL